MPSTSKTQQRLFGWALSCKRGEAKSCPTNVKKLADSMSEEELEKYASTTHKDLPEKVKEAAAECIVEMDTEYMDHLDRLDEKKQNSTEGHSPEVDDVKTPAPIVKNPPLPPGYKEARKEKGPMTPDLYKAPMGKKKKHVRRLMNFDQFLKAIAYRTHDSVLQKGHGQNLSGGK